MGWSVLLVSLGAIVCVGAVQSDEPRCNQGVSLGSCGAVRWVYNTTTGGCRSLLGCVSRRFNNFDSRAKCEEACVNMPNQERAPEGYIQIGREIREGRQGREGRQERQGRRRQRQGRRLPRWRKQPISPTRNENVCSLPYEIGRCRAAIQLWYYNQASSQCETFLFGGCGGNGNKFRTEDACRQRCG